MYTACTKPAPRQGVLGATDAQAGKPARRVSIAGGCRWVSLGVAGWCRTLGGSPSQAPWDEYNTTAESSAPRVRMETPAGTNQCCSRLAFLCLSAALCCLCRTMGSGSLPHTTTTSSGQQIRHSAGGGLRWATMHCAAEGAHCCSCRSRRPVSRVHLHASISTRTHRPPWIGFLQRPCPSSRPPPALRVRQLPETSPSSQPASKKASRHGGRHAGWLLNGSPSISTVHLGGTAAAGHDSACRSSTVCASVPVCQCCQCASARRMAALSASPCGQQKRKKKFPNMPHGGQQPSQRHPAARWPGTGPCSTGRYHYRLGG